MNNELSGSLEGVGLPAIVRFLGGLHKSGRLTISKEQFSGEVAFDAGRVVGASFGSRRGVSAIEALAQAVPDGDFVFAPDDPSTFGERNIDLAPEELQARLDDAANRAATGTNTLPPLTAIPVLIDQPEASPTTDPLMLDRGTLQTLLAVDGQRTVRELVSTRATFETLWHLSKLAELGLIRFETAATTAAPALVTPPPAANAPAPPAAPAQGPRPPLLRPVPTRPVSAAGAAATTGAATRSVPDRIKTGVQCPKLGFQDDPSSSFDRPTRLHRCFASSAPLPLSIDQQRELCLSDKYPTCPRLTDAASSAVAAPAAAPTNRAGAAVPGAAAAAAVAAAAAGGMAIAAGGAASAAPPAGKGAAPGGGTPTAATVGEGAATSGTARDVAASAGPAAPERPATTDVGSDPRIVRMPASTPPEQSTTEAERQAVGYPQPSGARPTPDTQPNQPKKPTDPTPLRARVPSTPAPVKAATVAAAGSPPDTGSRSTVPAAPAASPKLGRMADAGPRLAVVGVVVIVLGLIGFLVLPQLLAPAPDPNDLSFLGKDADSIAAGPPPAQVQSTNATVVAQATARAEAQAANQAAPTAVATTPAQAAAEAPKPAAAPPPPAPTVAPTPAPTVGPRLLLDERFADNQRGWISNPEGTSWLAQGVYNLVPRVAAQFVAVGAPQVQALRDLVVTATFRKVGGPTGGGYGIIVRDQGPGPRDGVSQTGQYYVLEVGDKGEVGIWRRDNDRWVDLVTWQATPAVRQGTATNDLVVRAVGDRLSLSVNGQEAAAATDTAIPAGGVGVFVGGDNNQVALERFAVQPAE